MMKYLFLIPIISIVSLFNAHSQELANEETSTKINEQLWKAFKKAYESRDAVAFNKLHTKDVVRITKNGILVGEEYRDQISKNYSSPDNSKRKIDFWMEHRIYTGVNGYEVGYFRVSVKRDDGSESDYYGRFSVVLRKVKNQWKIAQDWDTDVVNGQPITAKDFEKGKVLDLN